MFLQVLVSSLVSSVTILLFALGLSFVFGVVHIVNFAHGEFYMLGALFVWAISTQSHLQILGNPIVVYLISLLVAVLVVGILGSLIERLVFRPMKGDLLSSFIVSLGLIFVLQTLARLWIGVSPRKVPSIFQGGIEILGAAVSWERLSILSMGIVLAILLFLFLQKTRHGRTLVAVADDPEGAAIQGVTISKYLVLAMFIGCGLAAAAGGLLAPMYYLEPYMGGSPLMLAFAIVVIGGIGSLLGTVLGSFIVGFTDSFIGSYFGSEIALMVIFGILLLVLIVRPMGLLGRE